MKPTSQAYNHFIFLLYINYVKSTIAHVFMKTEPSYTFQQYQGYLVAMSFIVQSEPCTFEEAVKHQV